MAAISKQPVPPPTRQRSTISAYSVHFTAHCSHKYTFNLQVYTREWRNFSENPETKRIPVSLGNLRRLPPEVRFMIYDLTIPANPNCFDKSGTGGRCWLTKESRRPQPRLFELPGIAHVCQDMRQYAMRRYRLIWVNYSTRHASENEEAGWIDGMRARIERLLVPFPQLRLAVPTLVEAMARARNPKMSRIGFFDPRKDSIEIHLKEVRAVQLVKDATVEWDDPFQAPRLRNSLPEVTRYSRRESDNFFIFSLKETGISQTFWKPPWAKNQKPPRLL
ncbi:hypothetical protein F4861DRAFT_403889 [Xylaria intraflava]|nr:hypothetical protein F4861DRAFT_403889 [Xylaria intraflava]